MKYVIHRQDSLSLCCLCLLENDSSIISPDVLADDRAKFEASGDHRYIDKAHRRGKVGWDVGKHIEVTPLPASAHGVGLDRAWAGGAEDRATEGECGSSGGGREGADGVWGRVSG